MENDDEEVYLSVFSDVVKLKEVLGAPETAEYETDETDFENDTTSSTEEDGSYENDFMASTNDLKKGMLSFSNSYMDLDEVVLDEKGPSADMCRALSVASHDLLYIIQRQLLTLRETCQKKLKDVQDRIELNKHAHKKTKVTRSNWYYMFGIPYFKDDTYFPCPSNADHLEKTANKELSMVDLPSLRQWKMEDKMKLDAAVRTEEIANQIKDAEVRKVSLQKMLSETADPSKLEELRICLKECNPACIKNKSLAELLGNRKSEYDWMKISASDLGGFHTPDECRSMWHNYLHPIISKSNWTKLEDDKLKELVLKYNNQNWDAIAEELGTGRSGYQCMCQYQTRLNDRLRKSKWTDEEDNYLKEVVERCRIGSYIPWAKVTYYMDGRSKNQVFNRWTYSLDPSIKKSRFTKEEDILIVAAVRRYGTDFARVTQFLPGRTSVQVRDRYNSFLKYQGSRERWTPDEDSSLLELVKEYGEGMWSQISEHFANRTRVQVRHRYNTLQNWMRKVRDDDQDNADLMTRSAPTRQPNIDNREEKVWSTIESMLRSMNRNPEMNENNLRKLKEKLNLDWRKRRGRKLGHKKILSSIDKQYYKFFRGVYAQVGGRKMVRYDANVVEKSSQVISNMLCHFLACLDIPKTNSVIEDDCTLQELDKYILFYLRDKKHTNISDTVDEENKAEDTSEENKPTISLDTIKSPIPSTSSLSACPTNSSLVGMPCNALTIPYRFPPNHTTLVGFRTLLVSRRNISSNAEGARTGIKEDTDYSEGPCGSSSTSEKITPAKAAVLWKERLTSLFLWPAILSNTVPKTPDSLFQTENCSRLTIPRPVIEKRKLVNDSDNDNSNDVENVEDVKSLKSSKHSSKRRKFVRKKKDVEPKNKRKYEKSGKYKKGQPTLESGERRRSARCGAGNISETVKLEV